MPEDQPIVYVIAGPNGAGKTTFAGEFLPHFAGCREFVNADLIAAGLSPFAPETQAIRAGKLLLARIGELTAAGRTFAFETTLSGRGYAHTLAEMKRSGYRVAIFFLWLPSAEIALARVANRVRQGGHNIPEETVRRRHRSGLRNFFRLYGPLADSWRMYDGMSLPPILIAGRFGETMEVRAPQLWEEIRMNAEGQDHV